MPNLRAWFVALVAAPLISSCGGPPCRSQRDCPFGLHCVINAESGVSTSGECVADCFVPEDCTQPESNSFRAICTNEGFCRVEGRPPRLRVLEPEPDQSLEEGVRRTRVTGVVSATDMVRVSAQLIPTNGCGASFDRSTIIEHPNPGEFADLPFIIDDVALDTGAGRVRVEAVVNDASRATFVDVDVECEGCAELSIDQGIDASATSNLILNRFGGTVSFSTGVAVWRVRNEFGDVFDGLMEVRGGRFNVDRLPLFEGSNRIEAQVFGIGAVTGEARCSAAVSSFARDRGLRFVLSWDGQQSDLDLAVVGPGGRFGDALTMLSSRSPNPSFGGEIMDDFDGLGPEIATIEEPGSGTYGVVVEPVFDGADFGTNAVLRVLWNGRTLFARPIGPRFLSADRGDLWVVGRVTVQGDAVDFEEIDEVLGASTPPTTAPDQWPSFF